MCFAAQAKGGDKFHKIFTDIGIENIQPDPQGQHDTSELFVLDIAAVNLSTGLVYHLFGTSADPQDCFARF